MARCAYCGTHTDLADNGVSICLKCSTARERKPKAPTTDQICTILVGCIEEATAKVTVANKLFTQVVSQFASGFPHPDGIQRIKQASSELTLARKEMMTAHRRLNDFI